MLALVSICFILLGFFLGFECLINALVGINDKSDDNVDKNEILPLQKNQSDKLLENNEIVFPAYENPSLKDSKKRVKMT